MDRDLLVLSVFEIACSLVFTRGGGTRVEQLPAMLRRYFEPELLEVGWSIEGLSATLFNPAWSFVWSLEEWRDIENQSSSSKLNFGNLAGSMAERISEDETILTAITPLGAWQARCEHCKAVEANLVARLLRKLRCCKIDGLQVNLTIVLHHPQKSWIAKSSVASYKLDNHASGEVILTPFLFFLTQRSLLLKRPAFYQMLFPSGQ